MSELYELPEGWEWKKLTEVVKIGCDKGFKPIISDGKVPFIGMTDIDEDKGRNSKYVLEDYEKVSKGKTKFQKNAVLVGKITPCTQNNKTTIVPSDIDGGFATTEVYALHTMDNMTPLYLNYFIRSNKINEYLVSTMIGATGRQRVPSDTIKNLDIPLPPLSEQQRIVSKLDLLFEKIDKSIALHQKNMDEANVFMGSVLNDVFGELDTNETIELKYITSKIGSGSTPKGGQKAYKTEGISLIRSMNVHDNGFRIKGLAFIDDEQANKLNNLTIKENDILLNITGASVARCCIVDKNYLPARVNQHVSIIRLDDRFIPQFLHYYLISPSIKSDLLFSSSGGATREAITKSMLEEFKVPKISIITQQKVVKYLDEISKKIEKIKQAQKAKMNSLKALKASILDQAFKGEL